MKPKLEQAERLSEKERIRRFNIFLRLRMKSRERFEKRIDSIRKVLLKLFNVAIGIALMICKLIIIAVLSIGSIPIIYSLNRPMGEGYATFASYMVAQLLWYLIPSPHNHFLGKKIK